MKNKKLFIVGMVAVAMALCSGDVSARGGGGGFHGGGGWSGGGRGGDFGRGGRGVPMPGYHGSGEYHGGGDHGDGHRRNNNNNNNDNNTTNNYNVNGWNEGWGGAGDMEPGMMPLPVWRWVR